MTRSPETAPHRGPVVLTDPQLRAVYGGCGEECVCCYAPGDCYVEMCYCLECCCENGGGTDCMDMASSGCSM